MTVPLANYPDQPLRLTTAEVCKMAKLSRATLWRRVACGRLPQPIDHGRQALFCASAVAAALRKPAPKIAPSEEALARRFDQLMARRSKRA